MKKIQFVECKSMNRFLTEPLARKVDELWKELPEENRLFMKSAVVPSVSEQGEKFDISIITQELCDRQRSIVSIKGLDLEDYRKNGVVLYEHDYTKVIGKNEWIRYGEDTNSLRAKTIYAVDDPEYELPRVVFNLIKKNFLRGKSIGFLAKTFENVSEEEKSQNESLKDADKRITSGLLLEYSVVAIPALQTALVEQVSKSLSPDILKQLGITTAMKCDGLEKVCKKFDTIKKESSDEMLIKMIEGIDVKSLVRKILA